MRADYIEAVLDVIALIPPGKVLSYGDIAALLESGGPRQVGSVMSHHGSAAPWWRVVRAGGQPPVCHDARALEHYREEATPLRGETGGEHPSWRVDLRGARWNPEEPDFDAIDTIAARLQEPGTGTPGPAMSDPHGGMET